MEPFGELEYAEVDDEVSPTGVTEHSVLWTRNSPLLIEATIKAVKRHGVSRGRYRCPSGPAFTVINWSAGEVWAHSREAP